MKTLLGSLREGFTKFKAKLNRPFKIAITTTIGASIAVGSVYADSSENNSLEEIFHVYVDGAYLGVVDNKENVEQFIKGKETELEKQYNGVNLVPGQDIQFLREYVFYPKDDTEAIIAQLDQDITFYAAAVKLQLEDKLIGYVKDLDDANKALNLVVKKYLPKGLDENLEFLKKEDNEIRKTALLDMLPNEVNLETDKEEKEIELSDGTVVLDVGLTENIDFTEEKVDPNQILSVEQLQKLLERGTRGKKVHTISENEVLGQVAQKYDLSLQKLFDLNPGLNENSIIQVGQEVYVEDEKPYVDVTYTVEKTEDESIDYEIVYKNSDSLYKGESRVEQQGVEGKKRVTYHVTTKNNEVISKEKIDEEVIKEPTEKIVLQGTKVISSRGTGNFAWPTYGGSITSYVGYRWGAYHKGIDIAGVSNRTIMAADNGVVTFAGWDGGYGNKVVINHNNGYRTVYAHMSSIKVRAGQTVRKGQALGIMGTTGNSTGVHLHFEMYKNGALVNPLNYY
ncbi:peptidoglycan DD-metalloendopeptidase family protein [Bacillaceae bacterium W0354]